MGVDWPPVSLHLYILPVQTASYHLAVLDFVVGIEIQEAVFVYAGAMLVIVASLEWILLMVGYWE